MAIVSEKYFDGNLNFDGVCNAVYGRGADALAPRFAELAKTHKDVFGTAEMEFYSSPGRIEIVGNHTDHNGGKVLCAAIDFDTLASVSDRDDRKIEIKSNGYPMLCVDLDKLDFCVTEVGTSLALIKGVADYFVRSGKNVGGFSACMTSSVPKGSGVSSSSSFELAVAEILNVKYNGGELDAIFKAKAAQYAENVYFGKPCGLMDQSAIALGGVNLIDFADFENPVVKKASWEFDDLDIFVISTGGDHSDLTDDYAAIPQEMKEVAAQFGAKLLHEVSKETWQTKKNDIKRNVSERAFLRAEHFFEENERVERAIAAVESRNEAEFLKAVNESGESSRYKLQNTYSAKGKNRSLENALDSVVKIEGVVASRVHGGGFAGTILVFVKKSASDADSRFADMFGAENVFKLAIRPIGAAKLGLEAE